VTLDIWPVKQGLHLKELRQLGLYSQASEQAQPFIQNTGDLNAG
jgi:hypothetical protein